MSEQAQGPWRNHLHGCLTSGWLYQISVQFGNLEDFFSNQKACFGGQGILAYSFFLLLFHKVIYFLNGLKYLGYGSDNIWTPGF